MKKRLTCIVLLALQLACERPAPAPDITGDWRRTGERSGGQDLWCLYYYDTCALDDWWRFRADGSWENIDAGMPCGQPPVTGRWHTEGKNVFIDNVTYQVLRCDDELWLRGLKTTNGFHAVHELRFSRQ